MDADTAWVRSLRAVLTDGLAVHPRAATARKTVELVGHRSVVDMSQPVLTLPQRRLGYKFQAGEAAWILSGQSDVATISRYSREISKFSDDGVTFAGAYGPKFRGQLEYAVGALRQDPLTRQAVVSIWRECPAPSRDVPCTLSLQFLCRDGRLHCVATMRSSDLWLGWPYDVFNFSCMSAVVSLMLPKVLPLGELVLTAGSQHVYDNNFEDCVKIVNGEDLARGPSSPWLDPRDFLDASELVNFLWAAADGRGSLEALRARGRRP